MPPVSAPAGGYAVDDPDQPGRLTAWQVDDKGVIHRYPPGVRWEPMTPSFDHLPDRAERKTARERWYRDRYFPWKRRVIAAIDADPDRARAAFAAAYPMTAMRDDLRRELAERARQLRRGQDAFAALRHAHGAPINQLRREFGWRSWATAKARVEAGRALWAQDPDAALDLVAGTYEPFAGADRVRAVVQRLAQPLLDELVQGGRSGDVPQ